MILLCEGEVRTSGSKQGLWFRVCMCVYACLCVWLAGRDPATMKQVKKKQEQELEKKHAERNKIWQKKITSKVVKFLSLSEPGFVFTLSVFQSHLSFISNHYIVKGSRYYSWATAFSGTEVFSWLDFGPFSPLTTGHFTVFHCLQFHVCGLLENFFCTQEGKKTKITQRLTKIKKPICAPITDLLKIN